MPRSFAEWQAEQERESNLISLEAAAAKVRQRKRVRPAVILRRTDEEIEACIEYWRRNYGAV